MGHNYRKITFAFLSFCLILEKSYAQFLPHDVAVLLPLPQSLPDMRAITSKTVGGQGELLPNAVSKVLPLLEPSLDISNQADRLQVVGVRFDPPEIRLVWQVLQDFSRVNSRSKVMALDAAVHTFYRIENLQRFMSDLRKVSSLTRDDVSLVTPLSIHPTLLRTGPEGEYAKALRSLILEHTGSRNLFKMTFMAMSAVHLKWDFGGFNLHNGKISPLKIARVNTNKIQIFTNESFPPGDFFGGIGPAPRGQNEFNRLISDSHKPQVRERERLTAAHLTARRIENPRLETPDTIDCVSCHVAQPARLWTEIEFPSLRNSLEEKFISKKYLLRNVSPSRFRTDNVRSFGYFADSPAINQRAIHETVLTVEKLNGEVRR